MTISRFLKILHELGTVGFMGAFVVYVVLTVVSAKLTLADFATVRHCIDAMWTWVIIPSLLLVLLSGIFAMVAHGPYLDAPWAWIKALMTVLIMEGSFGVQSHAHAASVIAQKALAGEPDPSLLAQTLHGEWLGVWTMLALSLANIVIAIWRPRFRSTRTS